MYLDDMEVFTVKLEITNHTYSHVAQWCRQTLRDGTWCFAGLDATGHIAYIEFTDKNSMLMFVLRWS